MTRTEFRTKYRAFRTATKLWRFMDPDCLMPGVPSFVQNSPRGDHTRLFPDHLQSFQFLRYDDISGHRMTHKVRMNRLSEHVRLPG